MSQALQTFYRVSQPARGTRDASAEPSAGEISREGLGDSPLTAASNPSSASVQKGVVSSCSCLNRVCRKNMSVLDVLFPHSGPGSQNQMEPAP